MIAPSELTSAAPMKEKVSRLLQLQSVDPKAAPPSVQHSRPKPIRKFKAHQRDMSMIGRKQPATRAFSKGMKIRQSATRQSAAAHE